LRAGCERKQGGGEQGGAAGEREEEDAGDEVGRESKTTPAMGCGDTEERARRVETRVGNVAVRRAKRESHIIS
jgi:hypothetical protein